MQLNPHITHCKECKFKSFLFEDLRDEELEIFNQNRRDLTFMKGQTIIKEGGKINEFLYLKTGLFQNPKVHPFLKLL